VYILRIDRAVVLYDTETFEERRVQCCTHGTFFVGVRLIVTQGVLLSIVQDVSVSFGLITELISFCCVRDDAVLISRHFSNTQLRCRLLLFSFIRPFANLFVAEASRICY